MRVQSQTAAYILGCMLLSMFVVMACASSAPPAAPGAGSGGGVSGFGGVGGAGGFGGVGGLGGVGGAGGFGGVSGFGGNGGFNVIDGGDGRLNVHFENAAALIVDVVSIECGGTCVDVSAVAQGGRGAITYRWEDGSTNPRRTLCPTSDAMYTVTASDTPQSDGEFSYPGQSVSRVVSAQVLSCPDAGGGDAAVGVPCTSGNECVAGSVCYQGICVGDGNLRFSLSWMIDTDFDLHVITPTGIEIAYTNTFAEGGQLDVDDCAGDCRVIGGPHVENITFDENAPHGTYTYWVRNYSGLFTDNFQLQVATGGSVRATNTGTLSPFILESPHYTFVY